MSVAYSHGGPWTVDEVLALPEDTSQRVELVGGALMMSPAPGLGHQRASHRLHVLLEQAAEAVGADVEVFEAINVVVPDGLLIPDLAVVDAAATEEAGVAVSAHDVLTVVEIASPSTRIADRKLKPSLYAAAGIEHYWRVELEPAPRLIVGRLRHGTYTEQPPHLAGAVAHLDEPFPVTFDPARLTARR
ncbi:Uma2 family endonuclease [Streptomyces carminius]|uniref:Uma2 family endonuclease n=1 Tax=Streptomyces carminius TaxID=2665496 RepID=A0A2M8LZW8_9ACTN|nr:Uma2 family endonuclease [Streptomyces carminius]PJE97501.1 Uma2 family endonuclease [Streptomyces carminius]